MSVDTIPSNTSTSATAIVGGSVYGTIETALDADWWRIELSAGETYEVRLHGVGLDALEDTFITLRDQTGTAISQNDDSNTWGGGSPADSALSFTASTSGTYFIDVSAFTGFGGEDGDYLLSVEAVNSSDPDERFYTVDEIAWQLTNNYASASSLPPSAWNIGGDGALTVNLSGLDTAGRTLAEAALQMWSDVTGIQFQEVAGAAEITFDDEGFASDPLDAFAATNLTFSTDPDFPGATINSATVVVTSDWLSQFGTGFNSYSFETYIREIGAALGLGNAGNYDRDAVFGTDTHYANDSVAYSIMSFINARGDEFTDPGDFNPNLPADFRFMLTPAIADLIAIDTLYGDQVSSSTRTGDTTYGFGSNTGNAALDAAVTFGSDMFMTVYDDGGTDTLDFSGTTAGQAINLNEGTFSNVLGGVWNLSVARGTVIENAVGGAGNDYISGNAASNILFGNAGNDIINGGAGIDIMDGGTGTDVFYVDTFLDTVSELVGEGVFDQVYASANYQLTAGAEVERLATTTQSGTSNIILVGNEFGQQLLGNNGNNILVGGGGRDSFFGYLGDDIYVVDDASEFIQENAGQGYDSVYTATSFTLAAGLSIERFVTTSQAGTTQIDLTGNELDQLIGGNAASNTIFGGDGRDSLYGFNGNDFLDSGRGNDALFGGAGTDRFIFREALGAQSGIDRIYDFGVADRIQFDAVDITVTTALQANQFVLGSTALDADDRVLYDQANGLVYYDADGSGAQAAVLYTVINGSPVLDHSFFELI